MGTPSMRRSFVTGSHPDSGNAGTTIWQCPDCHSTDLVKLSLVYAGGLSEIDTHSQVRGLALAGDGIGVSFTGTQTGGTLQTHLSRIAAPPHKKRYRYFVLAWALLFIVPGWIALSLEETQPGNAAHVHQLFTWFSWIYLGLLVLALWVLWRYNHRFYPQRYREWDRSFMCRRCGKIVRADSQG